MKKLILLMLLLASVVTAQPLDWFGASTVQTQLNVTSTIDFEATGKNPYVQKIQADVIFIPQNTETSAVRSLVTNPPAIVTSDRARFTWNEPTENLEFGYSAIVEQTNAVPRVSAKIPFPAKFPNELRKYTVPTEHIDSNDPKIIGQAAYLAQGEDDLFVFVTKTAMWVKNNIDYNLSTLTADVSQSASWVLDNKYGVCDEITSLFIAMLRSQGIPARFISGLAFTSSEAFPQGWGAHGWAEVYFPGVGWVPFDPTFGEFGWLDPGHVKLKESLGPREPTTVYEWKARDVNVNVHDLEISAAQIATSGKIPSEVAFKVRPLRDRVGFGSYNGIILEVENLADYYVAPEFAIAQVNDMEILDESHKQVILPPRSKRRISWTVKVKDNLDPKYQYELPLQAYTVRNDTAKSNFHVGKWDVTFSKLDIESQLESQTLRKADPFDLACQPEKDKLYDTQVKLVCNVQNRQSTDQEIKICAKDDCKNLEIEPQKTKQADFLWPLPNFGAHEVIIEASTDTLKRKAGFMVTRLDEPKIVIEKVQAPGIIKYGTDFELNFVLSRKSVSEPRGVIVKVKGPGVKSTVPIGRLVTDQDVTINVKSSQLYSSNPKFEIVVNYDNGKRYEEEKTVTLHVQEVPWHKKLIGFFLNIF